MDKASKGWLQRIIGHLKASIFIFILAVLSAGSVVAQENKASQYVLPSFNLDYGNNPMVERAIDERIVDRFGSFDRSDDGGCYNVSLDLENEDSDWSFEVTVTMEF